MNVDRSNVAKRLTMRMIQKVSYLVPHELKDGDIELRETICEMLLQQQQRKGSLYRIITGTQK